MVVTADCKYSRLMLERWFEVTGGSAALHGPGGYLEVGKPRGRKNQVFCIRYRETQSTFKS